ncbi:hypothetical protein [Cysteiniphilum litorale]|uniref:hypothetical protein n=1 Tax=Cysteiniphilum litorale TaxID=2056700 RepID=UPI003F880E49
MHNLHFVITNADNHEHAMASVESEILEWGSEDNWFSAFAAISIENEHIVFSNKENRFNEVVTLQYNKIELIEEAINYEAELVPYLEVASQFKSNESHLTAWDYYRLGVYAKHMFEALQFKDNPYKVTNMQSFFGYQYDQFGITDFRSEEEDMPGSSYIVFVDMHS